MPFFQTETSETKSRLATTAVLFGKLHAEFVDNLSRVAENSAKQAAISVHDDESELLVVFEQFGQRFDVKLVVAEVQRSVDGPEGLKIYCDLTLLAVIRHHSTAIKHESVGGDL